MVLRSTVRRLRSLEPTWLSTARASFRNDARRARPSGRVTAEQQAALTDSSHHPSLTLRLWLARARMPCIAQAFPRTTHPFSLKENQAAENNSQFFDLRLAGTFANNSGYAKLHPVEDTPTKDPNHLEHLSKSSAHSESKSSRRASLS